MDELGVALRSQYAEQVKDLYPPVDLVRRVKRGGRARRRRAVLMRSAAAVVVAAAAITGFAFGGPASEGEEVGTGPLASPSADVSPSTGPLANPSSGVSPSTPVAPAFVMDSRADRPPRETAEVGGYDLSLTPKDLKPVNEAMLIMPHVEGKLFDVSAEAPFGPARCQEYWESPSDGQSSAILRAALVCLHTQGDIADGQLERGVRGSLDPGELVQAGVINGRPAYAVTRDGSGVQEGSAPWSRLYFRARSEQRFLFSVYAINLTSKDFAVFVAGLHKP